MRIVDRTEFLRMPPGTVFCKYASLGDFGMLQVKEWGTDIEGDYRYINLVDVTILGLDGVEELLAFEEQRQCSLEFSSRRDGLFDQDQLFIVFDAADVREIITLLERALDGDVD